MVVLLEGVNKFKFMRNILPFILLFVFFISCKKETDYKYSLQKKDSISIPINDDVAIISPNTYFLDSSDSIFLFQNSNMKERYNEILFFNIKNKSLQKRIVFSDINGYVQSINGFNIVGKDSLLLANGMTDSLYISDLDGKILNKKFFNFGDKDNFISQIVPYKSKPINIIGDKIYFTDYKWQTSKNDYLLNQFVFSYNLKTDKLVNHKVKYSTDYVNSEFFSNEFSSCFNENKLIISPLNSHKIWIIDLNDDKIEEKEAKSDHFREFLKFSTTPVMDMQEGMYNNTFYSQYVNIVYDKYRKVYYRFFYPGLDIKKNEKTLTKEYYHPKKMAIIILDENFNKIGEEYFSNHDFKMDYFVAPDGSYLNTNNELNKNYQEDRLKYTKLNLIKNEK